MYNPFVLACNGALEELSEVEIEELPPFEPDKQIVFVRNNDRSVKSPNHRRTPQVKPDIVLVRWGILAKPTSLYTESYLGNLCTSESNVILSWTDIRSTVEMKFRAVPRRAEFPTFDKDFGTLRESAPCTLPVVNLQPAFIPEELPANKCKPCAVPEILTAYSPPKMPSGSRRDCRRRNRPSPRKPGIKLRYQRIPSAG